MKFEKASTATTRRKWMSIEENFTAAEIEKDDRYRHRNFVYRIVYNKRI